MKPDNTWQGALVYADYQQDEGEEDLSARWALVGLVQRNAILLWDNYVARWSPTMLRTLPAFMRTKARKFEVNGQWYVLEARFAARQVILSLYRRSEGGGSQWSDGHRYCIEGETSFNRTTIAKHGAVACLREVSLRLTK